MIMIMMQLIIQQMMIGPETRERHGVPQQDQRGGARHDVGQGGMCVCIVYVHISVYVYIYIYINIYTYPHYECMLRV